MTDYNYISKGDSASTILGQKTTSKIAFYGITPVDQPAALTAHVSTLTYVTAATPTSIILCTAAATISGAGFISTAEFGGVCNAVKNAQIRIAELESRLVEVGIVAGGTAVATATATPYDYVGYGGDEGEVLGKATTSLVGFYGIAPCDQPTAVTTASAHPTLITTATTDTTGMTTTIAVAVSGSAGYGIGVYETDPSPGHSFLGMIANLQTRLAEVEDNLAETGLIAGGTALTSATGYNYLDKGNDDGTIFGVAATSKIAFWGGTPAVQADALTTARTTITFVSAVAATYAIVSMAVTLSSGFKFVTVTAGNTLILAVQNAQVRLAEIETAIEGIGIQAA